MRRNRAILIAVVLIFCGHALASEHREKGYQYLSPVPGAEYVLPQTKFFLVRFETVSPSDITNLSSFITVTGASSGTHSGQTKIATDDRTVIFEVSSGFSSDELVTVTLTPIANPSVEPYQYQFMVSGPMPTPPPASTLPQAPSGGSAAGEQVVNTQATPPDTESNALPTVDMAMTSEDEISAAAADGPMIMPNGVSIPSDFPAMDIDIYGSTAPGYIFIDYTGSGQDYRMILENSGAPVWYERGSARDFKVQKNGIITRTNFQGFDQNFNFLRSFNAVNGYSTDSHELQVLENGYYLLFGVRGQTVDMTRFHPSGRTNATVNETVLQEFTPEGDLIFQWRAWDNFDIRLLEFWSYDDKPWSSSIRFVHMNSVDVDTDGHLLVSSKRVSEVTKIHRYTGEVIWRMGSGHPTNPGQDPYLAERLTILNDPLPTGQFNVQHDLRVVGENRYTVFDNHHLDSMPNSRAVEYEVDPNARTATMVWQYLGGYDSYHMGNAQRLPNGNTLINWVITNAPKVTEVRPDGTKAFEMNWSARNSKSYRVFRFPWTGVVEKPYLIVDDGSYSDSIALIFNKFGDPNVDYYKIYGGTSNPPTTLLGTSTDTLMRIYTGLANGTNYFRVTAVDIHGMESPFSDVKSGFVNFSIIPGQNMVKNGDFSDEKEEWTWEVAPSADAEWLIESGVSHFDIANGGIQLSDIQLRQGRMQLVQGKEYIFEFDAWSATLPRLIEAKVGQNESPWTDYSKIGPLQITPNQTHYSHSFTMEDPSDFNARVEFNLGISPFDVYLDNVSLREDLPESEGVTIALVSDAADPLTSGGSHEDDELVAWLQSLDYTVDTNGMNQNMRGDWSGNAAIQTAVAAADLILVSRRTNSGNYNYDTLWNTNLAKPVILQSGYLDREERWGWNTSDDDGDAAPGTQQNMDVVAAGHPFLKGLSGSSIQIFDWDDPASTPNHTGLNQAPGSIYLSQSLDPSATLIGTFNGRAMLYEMAAGTVLASGDGTLGGHRVFFVNWSYDVADADYRWDDYLTDDYKTILHNIIKEVLGLIPGDFDFDGCVEFDDLAVLIGEWPQEQGGLIADLDGNGKVDFNDFAIFAENYMKSCP